MILVEGQVKICWRQVRRMWGMVYFSHIVIC